MSFIYAKKTENSIVIFADTKITIEQPDAKLFFSPETIASVKNYGMIKNMLLHPNVCVSYAGNNILYANEFLQKSKGLPLDKAVSLALEINKKDIDNGVSFIICYADDVRKIIYEIKNGECNEVDVAWIGSFTAFRYFQGVKNGVFKTGLNSNNPLGVELSFGTVAQSNDEKEFEKLSSCFHKTIHDCGDETVGGFSIPVIYNTEKVCFLYKGYLKSYASMKNTSKGMSLPMYQGAESGAFSVIFYESPKTVRLYIPENYLAITYSQYRKNISDYDIKQTAHFFVPTTIKMSQLDFYVQCEADGFKSPGFLGCNPEDIDEYLKRVWHYKDQPEYAILYINKAIDIVETQHREEWRIEQLRAIKKNVEAAL